MIRRSAGHVTLMLLGLSAFLGCNRVPSSTSVRAQGAVASVVQPATPATAEQPAPTQAAQGWRSLPGLTVREGAEPELREDGSHQQVQAARTERGWVLAWTDSEHRRLVTAAVGRDGRASGEPTVLRAASGDEEELWAPTLASSAEGIGVAWLDRGGGQLRFQRIDADAHPVGERTIIHDGLALPRLARLAWTGTEYALAVGLQEGLYFARISSQGVRIGEGSLLTEQGHVAAIDALEATQSGFRVQWREGVEGQRTRELRLSPQGRVLGDVASVSVLASSAAL